MLGLNNLREVLVEVLRGVELARRRCQVRGNRLLDWRLGWLFFFGLLVGAALFSLFLGLLLGLDLLDDFAHYLLLSLAIRVANVMRIVGGSDGLLNYGRFLVSHVPQS